MSSPKVIVQIAIAGAQIFGKAFLAAGRQAMQNAKHRPEGVIGSDVTGLRGATSGSLTDRLSREYRMTLDEARLILNVRKEDPMEKILQHYEHIFKANAPIVASKPKAGAEARPAASAAGRKAPATVYSHYLQSKVWRARERIEAENKAMAQGGEPLAEAEAGAGAGAKPAEGSSTGQQQDGGKAP